MTNKSEIIIREFQKGDETGICHVHVRSVREICSKDYSPEVIEDWVGKRQPQGYLDAVDKGENFWIIEVDGIIAGFGSWIDDRIIGFYMNPDFIGLGLAKQLFKKIEHDYLRNSSHKTCSITSTITARPFYERMGFESVRQFKHTLKVGRQIDAWEMIKYY